MFCNYCAAVNPDDSQFCSACGKPIALLSPTSPKTGAIDVPTFANAAHSIPPVANAPARKTEYSATYKRMSDEQLLHLKDEIGVLTDDARVALVAEVGNRNLGSASPQQASTGTEAATKALYGVHGWLGWFVFVRLVVAPIAFIVEIAREYESVTATSGTPSSVPPTYWLIDAVVCLGFASWSIYCGIALLKLKPNAPRITKSYFVALFFYYVLGAVLTIVANTKGRMASPSTAQELVPFFQGFAGIIIWYSYLENSKRVANTYSTQPHVRAG